MSAFDPSAPGLPIVPNGGGGVYIANVTLPGVTNPRQFLAELQRIGKWGLCVISQRWLARGEAPWHPPERSDARYTIP